MSIADKVSQLLPPHLNELEIKDLQTLYNDITSKKVDYWQVYHGIHWTCGDNFSSCPRDQVGTLLLELERREVLEKGLLWEMKLLGGDKTTSVTLDNALLLLKSNFGAKYGVKDWERFLASRSKSDTVSFLELRKVVCNFSPRADTIDDNGVEEIISALSVPPQPAVKPESEFERQARRNRYRVNANAWFGEQTKLVLSVVDKDLFIKALKIKYQILTRIALTHALSTEVGEDTWLVKSEGEKAGLVSKLEERVNGLRSSERLLYADHSLNLKGLLAIDLGLANVMGLDYHQTRLFTQKMIQHREKLFRQGHDESYVKEKEVMEYTKQRKENERGMSNLLHDLHKRHKGEEASLHKQLDGALGKVWSKHEREAMLALLYFQHYRAATETDFRPGAISVALVEHTSPYPEDRLFEEYDRWYTIAKYRVTRVLFDDDYDRLTGLPLAPLAISPVLALTGPQNTVREAFITLQRCHNAESVYLEVLLYSELEQDDHIKLLSSDRRELEDALGYLRQQRRDWRIRFTSSISAVSAKQAHQNELLKKAMFVKVLLVQYKHNLLEDADSAMVVLMSELVQLQDMELALLINAVPNMSTDKLQAWKESKLQQSRQGMLDNVAHTLLRSVAEYDDNSLLETIYSKYEGVRRVWIRQMLKSTTNYATLSQEAQLAEEEAVLVKERDLYSAGELYGARNVFGDSVTHPLGLLGLMGPNREITDETVSSNENSELFIESEHTDNMLMDIQFRYKDDKAYMLDVLKHSNTMERMYETSLLQWQIYLLQEFEDFDKAMNYVGVVEKIHLHPDYKLCKNTELMKNIAEHILYNHGNHGDHGNHASGHSNDELVTRDVFLEGTFRQILRKTLVFLLHRKHKCEQNVFSKILNGIAEINEAPVDLHKERQKRRGLREQLSAGQVAGTFISAVQKQQITLFTEVVSCSPLTKTELMSELLQSQMDEAATCVADMLTMGKLELSVLVCSLRQGIVSCYHDNIAHIVLQLDPLKRAQAAVAGWYKVLVKGVIRQTMLDSGLDVSAGEDDDLYREAVKQGEGLSGTFFSERGLKFKMTQQSLVGLLPVQYSQVTDVVEKERLALQQEELSEEERSGRVTELLKEVKTEALRESSKVDLASTLLRHKQHLDTLSKGSVDLFSLYAAYGQFLLKQEDPPLPILTCYFSHLQRMTVNPTFILHTVSIQGAARAFLLAYTKTWADKTPLGSAGILSLTRDYSTIHYSVASYRRYILSCVHKQHAMEISLLCKLLLDKELIPEQMMNEDEKKASMIELRVRWDRVHQELKAVGSFNEKSKGQLDTLHQQQRSLLAQSLALKCGSVLKRLRYMGVRQDSGPVQACHVEMLTELLQYHLRDIAESVRSLKEMSNVHRKDKHFAFTMLELASLKTTLHHNIKSGLVGAVANVCFTPLKLTPDEQLAQAVDDKYELLKDKLYAASLMKELGQQEWELLNQHEKQKKIVELRKKALQMKREGREVEVDQMFAEAMSDEKGMIKMLGVSKEDYLRALEEKKKRRKEKKVLEHGTEAEDEVELEVGGVKIKSILDSLENNFESEKEALMKTLLQSQDKFSSDRERQAQFVKLRLEKMRIAHEGNFEEAALVMGQATAMGQTQLSERERQEALAKSRIAARRLKQTKKEDQGEKPEVDLSTDDLGQLQESLALLIQSKHEAERDILQDLIEELTEDEKESVRSISVKERQKEIGLLREDQRMWREGIEDTVPDADTLAKELEKHRGWMKQAALLNLFNKMGSTKEEADFSIEDDTERAAELEKRKEGGGMLVLLVELQQKQEDEASMLLGNIKHKGIGDVQEMCRLHQRSLNEMWLDNIAAVVFARPVAESDAEDEIVVELNKKYDNMKDKLILQMLEKQMGQEEWSRMSEKDRQKKMMQLKLRDRQLRAAGREGEADELYKAMLEVDKMREESEGDVKKRQKERIKARLEYKKKRLLEGASKEDIEEEITAIKEQEEQVEQENKEAVSAKDMLSFIMQSFDQEKEQLLSQIRDGDGNVRNEKERQLALLKLKREQMRLKKDDQMNAASLVFTKAHAKDSKVADVRKQQLFMAKQRLLAKKEKMKEGEKEGEEEDEVEELKEISNAADAASTLQSSILQLVEEKQEKERQLYMNLVQDILQEKVLSKNDLADISKTKEDENTARITTLRRQRLRSMRSIKTSTSAEVEEERRAEFKDLQKAYLLEALAVKLCAGAEAGEAEIEKRSVELLADIQQRQDAESEGVITNIATLDVGGMSELRQSIHSDIVSAQYPNITTLLLGEVQPEDLVTRAENMEGKKSKRDKELKSVMEKRKKERELKKREKKEKVAQMLEELNNGSDQAVGTAAEQYEKHKEALEELLKKKELGKKLTAAEEELLAKVSLSLEQEAGPGLDTLSDEDKDAMMSRLKAQFDSQVSQLNAQREAQKKAMLSRMKMKNAVKEKKEDEEDTMMSMFGDFSRSQTIVREKTMVGHSQQKEKLSAILARKKQMADSARKEKEEKRVREEEEEAELRKSGVERPGERLLSREGSTNSVRTDKIKELDEDDKKQMLDTLVRQATSAQFTINREKNKQADILKARIRARQMGGGGSAGATNKRDKVQEEAEEILVAMERDKTQLHFVHSQELNRQKTIVKDRIRRMKEKTMTGAGPEGAVLKRQASDLGFSSHLTDEEKQLPKNEQMQLVASRMQNKFKQTAVATDGQAMAALQEDD